MWVSNRKSTAENRKCTSCFHRLWFDLTTKENGGRLRPPFPHSTCRACYSEAFAAPGYFRLQRISLATSLSPSLS